MYLKKSQHSNSLSVLFYSFSSLSLSLSLIKKYCIQISQINSDRQTDIPGVTRIMAVMIRAHTIRITNRAMAIPLQFLCWVEPPTSSYKIKAIFSITVAYSNAHFEIISSLFLFFCKQKSKKPFVGLFPFVSPFAKNKIIKCCNANKRLMFILQHAVLYRRVQKYFKFLCSEKLMQATSECY